MALADGKSEEHEARQVVLEYMSRPSLRDDIEARLPDAAAGLRGLGLGAEAAWRS